MFFLSFRVRGNEKLFEKLYDQKRKAKIKYYYLSYIEIVMAYREFYCADG